MSGVKQELKLITQRIIERSSLSRKAYLDLTKRNRPSNLSRKSLSAGNQAHAYAGCVLQDKKALLGASWPNIAIVTAYNDMLSAHAPYAEYPDIIKTAARKAGATAQVAGGVPAMCDGVTQGTSGMELSLFSRDVIAMSTSIALSHNSYDAGLYLGICDKIVPGLLIGALQYGHLPAVFVPAGPMPSGLPNKEKVRIRQLYAEGKISREKLLEAEMKSYHSQGTCTFYGTANSNQMLMEIMGLHIPGSAFVNPGTPLRAGLTEAAVRQAVSLTAMGDSYMPIADIVSVKSIVNAIVGLMATGGSTNHAIHIPAIARAAGIIVTWDDFDALSKITPLLTNIYPNGQADINHFHAAGGVSFLIKELLEAGLLHEDVKTVMGEGLYAHTQEPYLIDGGVAFKPGVENSLDPSVIGSAAKPFRPDGGLGVLKGALGRAIIKTSAVDPKFFNVSAPAAVFETQAAVVEAFNKGDLNRDVIVVVRNQGPRANGMPELHKLTPLLGVLQDKGYKVALVTDGRMSGASGKVPAAIHLVPEAAMNGAIAHIKNGDMLTCDAVSGELSIKISKENMNAKSAQTHTNASVEPQALIGQGRDVFGLFRQNCLDAENGATSFG